LSVCLFLFLNFIIFRCGEGEVGVQGTPGRKGMRGTPGAKVEQNYIKIENFFCKIKGSTRHSCQITL